MFPDAALPAATPKSTDSAGNEPGLRADVIDGIEDGIDDVIDVMPPAPSDWPAASLPGVCARGYDVHLLAPSGYADPEHVAVAIDRLAAQGHRLHNAEAAHRRWQRFAGADDQRLDDFAALAASDIAGAGMDASGANAALGPGGAVPFGQVQHIDIAMALRGGYGAVRLLERLDYAALRGRCELHGTPVICGFSDFTAIQSALYSQAGIVSFGGPMLSSTFGVDSPSAFTQGHFWGMIQARSYTVRGTMPGQPELDVAGTLWGGNLAMLASLAGTPYLPQIPGGILFIEDIHEQPFRTERMLYQLLHAGILQTQRAVLVGHFTESTALAYNNGFTLASVFDQMAEVSGVPFVQGLAFGHVDDMLTLPFGAPARLRSGDAGFALTMSDYPTLA